jgi:exopolyphosphatase / guanosine-5'-triphosphate,3'-diphosphate pyrophosphatase
VRCACVDIGSNTTRLLVAEPGEGGLRRVVEQRVFLRLHGDGRPVPSDRIEALCIAVAAHARTADQAGAEELLVVATAALRAAANAEAVCTAVRGACGHGVSILSAEDEAGLAFRGACSTLSGSVRGTVAVVDVGGGSTEIVTGTVAGGAEWSVSLPLGSGSLTDEEAAGDPPSMPERARMRARIAAALDGVQPPRAVVALAVGGSAASVRRMAGDVLDAESLARAGQAVCALPAAAVAARYGLHVERARLLPAGLLLLAAAAESLGRPLEVAAGGLREGILLARLEARS